MSAPRQRRQSGNVMLGTLLLAVLMTSVVLGYARHTLVAAGNAEASVATQRAESAADSGIAWARQTLLADGGRSTTLAIAGDAQVTVDVAATGTGLHTLTIESSASGVSQAMQGTVETYATVGGSLPQLTAAARTAVLGHGSLIDVSGNQTYTSQTLTGVLYLRNGARLTLTNCIVAGSIVSEPAVNGTWAAGDRTSISLTDTVVIESDPALAGCSIIAPDAAVTGAGTEAVQVRGVIVCDSLSLAGWGALHRQVATAQPPSLAAGIAMPGSGREPRAWPAALETGAEGISRMSFPRAEAGSAEQQAIEDFVFPGAGG